MIAGFINGLKKSFSFKRYSRDVNPCYICGKPAFSGMYCLQCEVDLTREPND